MYRVVFDTVIFVRSMINPRGRWGRVVFDHVNRYQLVVSQPILMEVLEVLTRSYITRKYRALATQNLQLILGMLADADAAEVEAIPAVSRDPKDDKFLATAVAGNIEYLVSEDRDLLDIGEYEGVKIIDGATFLDILVGEIIQ